MAHPALDCLVEHYRLDNSDCEGWRRKALLGRGSYGDVWLEENVMEGKTRAVKTVPRLDQRNYRINAEVLALVNLSQARYRDHFGEFIGFHEDDTAISFFMEFFPKGDLRQHLPEGETLSEPQCKVIIRQILRGVQIMHDQSFTHRDLKPDNIFVVNKDPWRVKIGDFGVAKRVRDESTLLQTTTGTRPYMAPEIFLFVNDPEVREGEYTNRVDIWSLGIILFELITGRRPFFTQPELKAYCEGRFPFPDYLLEINNVSPSGIAFVRTLLSIRPTDRPSAHQALKDPWFNGMASPNPATVLSRPQIMTRPTIPVRHPLRPLSRHTDSSVPSDYGDSSRSIQSPPRSYPITASSHGDDSPTLPAFGETDDDLAGLEDFINPSDFPQLYREVEPIDSLMTSPEKESPPSVPYSTYRSNNSKTSSRSQRTEASGLEIDSFALFPAPKKSAPLTMWSPPALQTNSSPREPPMRQNGSPRELPMRPIHSPRDLPVRTSSRLGIGNIDTSRMRSDERKPEPTLARTRTEDREVKQPVYRTRYDDKEVDYNTRTRTDEKESLDRSQNMQTSNRYGAVDMYESQDTFKEASPLTRTMTASLQSLTIGTRRTTPTSTLTRTSTAMSESKHSIRSGSSINEEIPLFISDKLDSGEWKLNDTIVFVEVRNWDLIRISALAIRAVTPVVKLDQYHHKNYVEDFPNEILTVLSRDWLKRQFAASGFANSLTSHSSFYQTKIKDDILRRFDPLATTPEMYDLKLPFSHADEGSTEYLRNGHVKVPSTILARTVEKHWRDSLSHYIYGFVRDKKIAATSPVRALVFDQPGASGEERLAFFEKHLKDKVGPAGTEVINLFGFKAFVEASRKENKKKDKEWGSKSGLKGFGKFRRAK